MSTPEAYPSHKWVHRGGRVYECNRTGCDVQKRKEPDGGVSYQRKPYESFERVAEPPCLLKPR